MSCPLPTTKETKRNKTDTIPTIKPFFFAPSRVEAEMIQDARIIGRNTLECNSSQSGPFLLLALADRDDSRKAENCGGSGGNLDAGLQAGRLPNGSPRGLASTLLA
jgi:hypothetical protein